MSEDTNMSKSPDGDNRTKYSERATAAAHEAVDRIGEQAAHTEERIHKTADGVRRQSHEVREHATEMSEEATVKARTYVREHPIASLTAAFGVGVLLSTLMRR
jgi:ElaB/YqjD/DUF883 family membrane-anchored ribosome-binding protein